MEPFETEPERRAPGDAVELSVLEALHERAQQELRDAFAEARRIRNEAMDQADELWLRTYQNAQRQAALILEEARLRASASLAAVEASAMEPIGIVVPIRRATSTRPTPPVAPPAPLPPAPSALALPVPAASSAATLVAPHHPVAWRATPTAVIPVAVAGSVIAAAAGLVAPVAGVVVAAGLLVALLHVTTNPANEPVVGTMALTPAIVMARLALPVNGLSRPGFVLTVAVVSTLAAWPLDPVQRGHSARADALLLMRSIPLLAVAALGADFRPAAAGAAAAGAIGGACLLGLVVTPTARTMRARVVHPAAAAGFTALLLGAASGATQVATALAVVGVGALTDRHLASGGRMRARLLLGVVFGSIVGCVPW